MFATLLKKPKKKKKVILRSLLNHHCFTNVLASCLAEWLRGIFDLFLCCLFSAFVQQQAATSIWEVCKSTKTPQRPTLLAKTLPEEDVFLVENSGLYSEHYPWDLSGTVIDFPASWRIWSTGVKAEFSLFGKSFLLIPWQLSTQISRSSLLVTKLFLLLQLVESKKVILQ